MILKNHIWICATVLCLTVAAMGQVQLKTGSMPQGTVNASSGSIHLSASAGELTGPASFNLSEILQSGFWAQTGALLTSVHQLSDLIPKEFRLDQNYPNPFNPETTIRFALPQAGHVFLRLFDVTGRRVSVLLDEHREAGAYIVRWDASQISNGVYFYEIQSGSFRAVRKMVLVK